MSDGIFDLKTIEDLYKKVKFDYSRFKREPNNSYAAFDLFMTAAHMPDWITNGDLGKSKSFRKSEPILRVCYQLACNGKHFHLTGKEHDTVGSTKKDRYVEPGYIEEGYFDEPLLVTLTGNLASKLNVSSPASAIEIADKVVEYPGYMVTRSWQKHITNQSMAPHGGRFQLEAKTRLKFTVIKSSYNSSTSAVYS